ncbi:WD40 repeat-like protein [Rhizoctonia solani]|uniref:WD40 repeat-like protein n=1 Tax=Rhizoctonia solani TaxID=456999 RepID=A0A8H7IBV3_9AGAM|nr:WD40 repeat-like protein [Rhizoctonia solani]
MLVRTWIASPHLSQQSTALHRQPSSNAASARRAQGLILAQMHQWASIAGSDDGAVYWLNGMAGTGKTTIAYSLCAELDKENQLAASFFCSRLLPECRDVNRIIPSIAYQLAQHSPVFGEALIKALERDPDIQKQLPSMQFASLISEPLTQIRASLPGIFVVVIDALDECESQRAPGGSQYNTSSWRQTEAADRFFVSSRPEPEIRQEMERRMATTGILSLFYINSTQTRFKPTLRIRVRRRRIDEPEREDILQVLHTVTAAQEPLAVASIAALLQIGSEDRVRAAIRPLWSVLHITGSNELVATLHASFPDYMLSKERSGDYYCDRKLYDSVMTRRALNVPNLDQKIQNAVPAHLLYACRYFASHLESATEPHELATLVQEFMSTQLLLWLEVMNLTGNIHAAEKAMRRVDSWAMHSHVYVSMLPFWPSSRPISQAYKGLYRGLPEVGGTAMDMRQLAILATWSFFKAARCAVFSRDGSRVALASELEVIVVDAYSGRPIVEPLKGHISTVSSVDFSPDGTRIVSGSDDLSIWVWDVESGQLVLGPLQGHSSWINSVQYSPDETCIASCSYDGPIRIYDATTGETRLVSAPEEHRSPISSIRYSPDGTHIVAGLHNGKLYVWQASTGALVLGPLQAHTGAVLSVDYSPDGTHIVSGSDDKTVRIWNAVNGHAVPGPLMEQNTAIRSVRYSPDGRHIASGSYDGTICVWDPQTGMAILGPLKAHSNSISSICYSPDGARIVSCAYNDPTVHAWDARRRQKALPVAEGCAEQVGWLAYSPDSSCIVSASGNHIHMWDARTGSLIHGPIKAHTSSVSSVDYSPTGDQFASGSWDKTICTWDAQTGHMLLGPLTGHTARSAQLHTLRTAHRLLLVSQSTSHPMALASYPALLIVPYECGTYRRTDSTGAAGRQLWRICRGPILARGDYICSTQHNVIWVLNAHTGDVLSGPHMGHTDHVSSIAISRDGTRIVSGSNDRAIRVWDVDAKPSSSSNSNSTTSSRGVWKLNDDGWAVDVSDSSRLLVWVPHDLRAALMLPQTPFLISEKGYLTLDF